MASGFIAGSVPAMDTDVVLPEVRVVFLDAVVEDRDDDAGAREALAPRR